MTVRAARSLSAALRPVVVIEPPIIETRIIEPRRRAREVVLQILYADDMNPQRNQREVADFLRNRLLNDPEMVAKAEGLLSGVRHKREELDAHLQMEIHLHPVGSDVGGFDVQRARVESVGHHARWRLGHGPLQREHGRSDHADRLDGYGRPLITPARRRGDR